MMLDFDGVDDLATLGLGAIPSTAFNDITIAVIADIDTVSRWNNLVDLESSANAARWGLTVTSGNRLRLANSGAFSESSATLTVGTGKQLLAATRVSGAAATLYRYLYSTDAFTSDTGGALANETLGSSKVVLGAFTSSSDFYDGKLKIVGVWTRALSAAEIRTLAHSLRAWYASAPAAAWLLDQDATTQRILDFTGGGANESSRVGTAISTSSLPSFSYGYEILWRATAAAGGTAHTQSLAGTITPTSALVRLADRRIAGSVAPTSAVARLASATLAGAATPSGAAVRATDRRLVGATAPTGASTRLADRRLAGTVAPAGALVRAVYGFLSGATAPTGSAVRLIGKSVAGAVAPTGALATIVAKFLSLAGSIAPVGAVRWLMDKRLAGAVAPAGTVVRAVSHFFAGAATPAGALANALSGAADIVTRFFKQPSPSAGDFEASPGGGQFEPPSPGQERT